MIQGQGQCHVVHLRNRFTNLSSSLALHITVCADLAQLGRLTVPFVKGVAQQRVAGHMRWVGLSTVGPGARLSS